MSYYDYDPNDIALSIQKAIDERADPAAVSYLLMERNKKISDNPQYAGYRNDVITRQAEDYIAKYSPASTQDLDMLYEARRDLAIEDLEMASKQNEAAYRAGVAEAQAAYADARNGIYSTYQRDMLSNEELLASQGLGRGSSNAASSGFGETSRTMQSTAYQNNLYNTYKDETAAVGALASQYLENQNEAQRAYNETLSNISSDYTRDMLAQRNADRDYRFKVDQSRLDEQQTLAKARNEQEIEQYERALERFKMTGVITDEAQAQTLGLPVGATTADYENMIFTQNMKQMEFDSEEEQRAFENSLAERKFENEQQQDQFERAYNLFKGIGNVQTEEMASVLGIPVGTTYWNYVIAQRNAATSAARAANSASNSANSANLRYLEYEVAKQKADTAAYEAETDRMKLTGEY